MAFQVSPGIYSAEYDYTTRATSVTTAAGAIAGVFSNGPVDTPTFITSENQLLETFGPPTDENFETWFTAADFLSYSSALWVNRIVPSTTLNAVTTGTPGVYKTAEDALANTTIGTLIARTPGTRGNKLKISICPSADAFSSNTDSIASITMDIGAKFATITDYAELAAGDILQVVDSKGKKYDLVVSDASTANVQFSNAYTGKSALASATGTRKWGYYKAAAFKAPTANCVHIVVIDEDGGFKSGSEAGSILEVYDNVSVVAGTRDRDGNNKYYKDQINYGLGKVDLNNRPTPSKCLYATGATISASGSAVYASLAGGVNGTGDAEANVAFAELTSGYDVFVDKSTYDIRYLLQGKGRNGTYNTGLANYIIDNVCEVRKDCLVFITPSRNSVSRPYLNASDNAINELTAFRNALNSSSYAVLDSGYKYRYDAYNNVYRWTPMNGDIAGLVARTAVDRDPWYSPAGYNRGKLKNVIKLAFNPSEAERDLIYPLEINPVINQAGEGTVLFGDKTLLGAGSAFDHINVRMLFIAIKKAIENAAKSSLFEFNDAFTRAQFKNIVEPYLRDVQGRRGIYDFKVVCDETNNTPEVIDSNMFIGDVYIKPARSINYIKLNFISVDTGRSFNEIVGNF